MNYNVDDPLTLLAPSSGPFLWTIEMLVGTGHGSDSITRKTCFKSHPALSLLYFTKWTSCYIEKDLKLEIESINSFSSGWRWQWQMLALTRVLVSICVYAVCTVCLYWTDCWFHSWFYLRTLTAAYKPSQELPSMIQQDAVTGTKGNSIIPHINNNSREPLLQRCTPWYFFNHQSTPIRLNSVNQMASPRPEIMR